MKNNKRNINSSNKIGSWGEDKAVEYLINKGFCILKRNFYSRLGEIDIIAKKDNLICFIEVKTRKKGGYKNNEISYILPAEAVDYSKQQRLIRTAEYYLYCNFSEEFSYRFDIIEVFYYDSYIFSINHLEGAFEV